MAQHKYTALKTWLIISVLLVAAISWFTYKEIAEFHIPRAKFITAPLNIAGNVDDPNKIAEQLDFVLLNLKEDFCWDGEYGVIYNLIYNFKPSNDIAQLKEDYINWRETHYGLVTWRGFIAIMLLFLFLVWLVGAGELMGAYSELRYLMCGY